MSKISLDDLTPDQEIVITAFITEGKLQAYEELLEYFTKEHSVAAPEDPYYAYYVKHVIEQIKERYEPIKSSVDDEQPN
jgi:hypothetical protein